MNIGVAYTEPEDQLWIRLEVPDGSTVMDAIERSGLLARFPHIDLGAQKVGIFGKITTLDAPLKEGDRVEVYRPIIADPALVRRRDTNADEGGDRPHDLS
jgi:putative ubiquitin-RnfH superfamily antitoxin RatB of RatAB toxin-antitoxin module